jgi:prevent-host-death family protein
MTVTIHEAKTHLSKLIQQVMAGEEVIIAKGSKPLVVLQRLPETGNRVEGRNRGKLRLAEDFDTPLAEMADSQ